MRKNFCVRASVFKNFCAQKLLCAKISLCVKTPVCKFFFVWKLLCIKVPVKKFLCVNSGQGVVDPFACKGFGVQGLLCVKFLCVWKSFCVRTPSLVIPTVAQVPALEQISCGEKDQTVDIWHVTKNHHRQHHHQYHHHSSSFCLVWCSHSRLLGPAFFRATLSSSLVVSSCYIQRKHFLMESKIW